MVSSLAQTLQVALLLSAPAVWASPVLLDRRQAESNSSAASSSATGSSSENSSTSASSTGVPESIASAASSFQSSAPSPTGSADGQGVSSARYPYTCPDDYLLTYAFNQISLEQTVEELLPVVNWTNPRYAALQGISEGEADEEGATRSLQFYGNVSQEELLDFYSYNSSDGGFLTQIWNLTNGPLQYSEELEIFNYTTQLQVYANETDQGASTLKLFTNLCASDQVLGYTSFSAYLGTLASNIRIGAITGGGVQSPGGSPSGTSGASSKMSSMASSTISGSASSSGSSMATSTSSAISGSASSAMPSDAPDGAAPAPIPGTTSTSPGASSESSMSSESTPSGAPMPSSEMSSPSGDSASSASDAVSSSSGDSASSPSGDAPSSSGDSASPDGDSSPSATASTQVSGDGEPLTLVTPGSISTCEDASLQFSGGNAPYTMSAKSADNGVPLSQIPLQSKEGTYKWTCDIRSNVKVVLQIRDRNGNTAESDPITIQSGSSSDCLQ